MYGCQVKISNAAFTEVLHTILQTIRNNAHRRTSLDDCRAEAKALGEPLSSGSSTMNGLHY